MKTDNIGFIEFIPLIGKKNNMEMNRLWDLISRQSQVEKGQSVPGCEAELEVVVPNPQCPAIPRLLWSLHILWKQAAELTPETASLERPAGPSFRKRFAQVFWFTRQKTQISELLCCCACSVWFCKDICLFSLAICLVLIFIYSVQRDVALRNFQRHQKTLLGIQEVLQNRIRGKTKWEEEISLNSNRLTQNKPKNLIKPQSSNQARDR